MSPLGMQKIFQIIDIVNTNTEVYGLNKPGKAMTEEDGFDEK